MNQSQENTPPNDQDKKPIVLIAEDEHLLAQALIADLHELGYDTLGPAPNGEEAIELARTQKPDLALLDIRMEKMDGLEAASVLYKEMGVPVVILSAYSDASYLEQAQKVGVFGYLLKPVTRENLAVSLPVAMERSQSHDALQEDVGKLEAKLEERKLIERAKGILQQSLNISEPEAMRRLQKQARDNRKPMAELAKALIDAQDLLKG